MYIFSHNRHSRGAANLSRMLGIRRIKHNNSRFRGRNDKLVVNWGASEVPEQVLRCNILNVPDTVSRITNKLSFMLDFQDEEYILPFTPYPEIAREWAEERTVVCRQMLRASGGRGIVIAATPDEVVNADLYVQYKKKRDEYRIHLFNEGVVDIQKKAKIRGEEANYQVRNHSNGWIFMREGVDPPHAVLSVAEDCFAKTGLTFGAVDVIWNEHEERAYVLEINTAPGLEGTTLQTYAEQFRRYQ